MTCNAIIDLSHPIRRERVRAGFQPHWRTVFIYKCPACGAEHRVFASAFCGTTETPGIGGIVCNSITPEHIVQRVVDRDSVPCSTHVTQ